MRKVVVWPNTRDRTRARAPDGDSCTMADVDSVAALLDSIHGGFQKYLANVLLIVYGRNERPIALSLAVKHGSNLRTRRTQSQYTRTGHATLHNCKM